MVKRNKVSVRALAAQMILQVLDQGKSLSTLIPQASNQLPVKDLPLLQEICFGVCRTLPRLEAINKLMLSKPLVKKARIGHCLLLVSFYQLLYMRVPAHAAVDEAVNATRILKVEQFKGLVNGVLRRFLREQEQIMQRVDKGYQTLHPEWIVQQFKQYYPEQWRSIVEENNLKPPMWLRVNRQKFERDEYSQLLIEANIDHELGSPDCAIHLTQAVSVTRLPLFEQGAVTVQDSHAQWAAKILSPQNGELILDACAAPGGKTTHILEIAPQAEVIAIDADKERLKRVDENLNRLSQKAKVMVGDATQPQQWWKENRQFDRILLDAPCSATGVIRRHPDIKWLRKEADIQELASLQKNILNTLWGKLKPGGTLVYATCSLLPQENSLQIKQFLQSHSNAKLIMLNQEGETEFGWQLFPYHAGGDGFFYAKLYKNLDSDN